MGVMINRITFRESHPAPFVCSASALMLSPGDAPPISATGQPVAYPSPAEGCHGAY